MPSTPDVDRIAKRLRTSLTLFSYISGGVARNTRILRLAIITFISPAICAVASQVDETVILYDGRGHGFLQHFGYFALFGSCPAILVILLVVFDRAAKVIGNNRFTGLPHASGRLNSFQKRLVAIMTFRHSSSIATLAFAAFIGAVFVIVNAYTTKRPEILYNTDVWDGASHPWGYLAGRAFVAYLWIFLYPVGVTTALSSVYVAWSIVSRVTRNAASAELPPYAPDGCGGFRALGELMLAVVYLNAPIAPIIFALAYMHGSLYWTLEVGVALLLGLVAGEMFLPFIQLHTFLSQTKNAKLLELQTAIENLLARRGADRDADLALLAVNALYERTSRLSTWPYVSSDTVRVALSIIPVITALARARAG